VIPDPVNVNVAVLDVVPPGALTVNDVAAGIAVLMWLNNVVLLTLPDV
jgi:hypothetical protein